ncbi:MAG: uroporphyrinogen-III synthase [Bacillota bacterium]
MRKALIGKRIVIAASRKTEEMSMLVKKQGGTPIIRPLQGTVFLGEKNLESDLIKFIQEGADWAIFTTGIGVDTLLEISDKLGIKDEFINRIHEARIASRGYKTLLTLKKLGVKSSASDGDGTTRSLIKSLEGVDFNGKKVMVQLHGESAPTLIKFLKDKGAIVSTILPYEHIPPDIDVVAAVYDEITEKKLDAVCFTTAIQVRSLFDYARDKRDIECLLSSLGEKTLAVAVGKVTAEALTEEGVERIIVPKHERMGAMIVELSRYFG